VLLVLTHPHQSIFFRISASMMPFWCREVRAFLALGPSCKRTSSCRLIVCCMESNAGNASYYFYGFDGEVRSALLLIIFTVLMAKFVFPFAFLNQNESVMGPVNGGRGYNLAWAKSPRSTDKVTQRDFSSTLRGGSIQRKRS
jgi:hypothetical protein